MTVRTLQPVLCIDRAQCKSRTTEKEARAVNIAPRTPKTAAREVALSSSLWGGWLNRFDTDVYEGALGSLRSWEAIIV